MALSIRKALGAVKDQTSIGLARVSSNIAPELDVAIVKATSHEDEPADEKYFREILSLTSYSRAYVGSCVAMVSRRLGRTRDWVVALKALMLVHRLLNDGDRVFQYEILHATRRGARLLNMADFRDEAHSNSWDLSAFVRTYALYLDQRLECSLYETKQQGGGGWRSSGTSRDGGSGRSYGGGRDDGDSYRRSYSNGENDSYGNGGTDRRYSYSNSNSYSSPPPPLAITYGESGSYNGGYHRRGGSSGGGGGGERKAATPARDMKPERALGRMRQLQQLLDRFLACRPTGRAKISRLVLVALYPVVRESFQLYADVCEMLAVLLDRFFDMEYPDCVKAFEAYATAAKQIDELVAFYGWCKDIGVARSSEYPEVQRITDKLLETLEEFLRDKSKKPKSPERVPIEDVVVEPPPVAAVEEEEVPVEDMNGVKALPAPEGFEEKVEEKKPEDKKRQETGDLVDLRDETFTADDQGNRFALALFSAGASNANGNWDGESEVSSAWQNPAAEPGKADWELALVETASNLSKQKSALPGGFDSVLLDGMYDQGAVRQHVNSQVTGGSASSVALPLPGLGRNATPVLALPAPDGTVTSIGQDPFAASLSVPPPSYVQMAEIENKQQLLVQEQQLWNQYARNGMQGQVSLSKLSMGYNPVSPVMPAMPYGYGMPPPVHGGGYYYAPY